MGVAANQAGAASGGAGAEWDVAGGGEDEGGARGGVDGDDSVDFDQFVQAELMTELPDADPDAQVFAHPFVSVSASVSVCMREAIVWGLVFRVLGLGFMVCVYVRSHRLGLSF